MPRLPGFFMWHQLLRTDVVNYRPLPSVSCDSHADFDQCRLLHVTRLAHETTLAFGLTFASEQGFGGCMFGLWSARESPVSRFRRRTTGLRIRIGRRAYAPVATSNRVSRPRVICPSHSMVERLTRPVAKRLTKPSMNAPPGFVVDTAVKDSWS